MSIINPPFTRETLDEEKRADTFTVRLNKEERDLLEEMKRALNMPFDSKAIKFCARIGWNVLLSTFGKENLLYLFSQERRKLEEP